MGGVREGAFVTGGEVEAQLTRRQMHAVRMGGKEGGGLVAEVQLPVTEAVLVHPGDRIEKAGDEGLFAG